MMKKAKKIIGCVVKRGRQGACYPYDEKKIYGSVYGACYSVLMGERECERVSGEVSRAVTKHLVKRKSVSSEQIAKMVVKELKKRNPHAAFMYETHRDIS